MSMSTLKQIEANRLNAKKSTGPRTAEGKAAVRLNALKHGLFALDPIIEGENPVHFDAPPTNAPSAGLFPPAPINEGENPLHFAPPRPSHYERFNPAPPEEHVLLAAM